MQTSAQTYIVTPVSTNCNLRCSYCFHHSSQLIGRSTGRMSRDTVKSLVEQAASINKTVHMIWHGGEPTLIGIDFYRYVVDLQARCSSTRFYNSIQTNGTNLNKDWLSFLGSSRFSLGVTLDGPKHIHDQQRFFVDGRGTFETVLQTLHKLNRKANVLAVVTKHSLGYEEQILELFVQEALSFDLLPYYEANPTDRTGDSLVINSEEYAAFMIKFFDLWYDRDDPSIKIRFFWQVLRALHGGKPQLCRLSNSCATYVTVDANGDVYPCDRFCGQLELRYGNLLEESLSQILASSARTRFKEEVLGGMMSCQGCQWFRLCHGDCTYHRYVGQGRFDSTSFYCKANQRIFSHIAHRV